MQVDLKCLFRLQVQLILNNSSLPMILYIIEIYKIICCIKLRSNLSVVCRNLVGNPFFVAELEQRPKTLLIFVNPYGGKGKAKKIYSNQV